MPAKMVVYKEFSPPEPLDEFVKCFWILQKEYGGDKRVERVLPDSYIEFILSFGECYYLNDPGDLPDRFMIGLLKQPLRLQADGTVELICARFYPWGVLSFLDFKPSDTVNTEFDLRLSLEKSDQLAAHLREGRHDQAIHEFSDLLLELFARRNFDKNTVSSAAQILYREKGECRIEDIVKLCFTTQRTLERNFNTSLGMSPKAYAKNVRFDSAKKMILADPFVSLTDLAQHSGYFDQAHFVKDFKEFCGCTPSDFAEGVKRMSAVFSDKKNVVFLQGRG